MREERKRADEDGERVTNESPSAKRKLIQRTALLPSVSLLRPSSTLFPRSTPPPCRFPHNSALEDAKGITRGREKEKEKERDKGNDM